MWACRILPKEVSSAGHMWWWHVLTKDQLVVKVEVCLHHQDSSKFIHKSDARYLHQHDSQSIPPSVWRHPVLKIKVIFLAKKTWEAIRICRCLVMSIMDARLQWCCALLCLAPEVLKLLGSNLNGDRTVSQLNFNFAYLLKDQGRSIQPCLGYWYPPWWSVGKLWSCQDT